MRIDPYSWDFPDRSLNPWSDVFDRLVRQIDTTVQSVQQALRPNRMVVFSVSAIDSRASIVGSSTLPGWSTVSFFPYGAVVGQFNVARSGSLVQMEFFAQAAGAQDPSAPGIYDRSRFFFRCILNPGSLVIPGNSQWCVMGTGELPTTMWQTWEGALPVGPYLAELQVRGLTAANQQSAMCIRTGVPIILLATETRS